MHTDNRSREPHLPSLYLVFLRTNTLQTDYLHTITCRQGGIELDNFRRTRSRGKNAQKASNPKAKKPPVTKKTPARSDKKPSSAVSSRAGGERDSSDEESEEEAMEVQGNRNNDDGDLM